MITKKTNELVWCPKLRGGTDNIWFPAYVQTKIDGEYEVIYYKNREIYMVNKHGLRRSDFPALNEIKEKIENSPFVDERSGISLIAELYFDEGKNNDLYKLLANKTSDNVKLYVHDIMLQKKTTEERMIALKALGLSDNAVRVENSKQIEELFNKAKDDGYEGIVIKPAKANMLMAGRWVKMKSTDETRMVIIDMCDGQERVELKHESGTCGAKCPDFIKRSLSLGDRVLVRHFGFLDGGGVRNPIIIKEAKDDLSMV